MKLKFLAISLVTTNIVPTGAQWFNEERMRHWTHCEACQISAGNVSISLGGNVNYYTHEIKVYLFLAYPPFYSFLLICIHCSLFNGIIGSIPCGWKCYPTLVFLICTYLSISHQVILLFNVYDQAPY